MRVRGYEQADAALAGDADQNAVRDIVELLSQSSHSRHVCHTTTAQICCSSHAD